MSIQYQYKEEDFMCPITNEWITDDYTKHPVYMAADGCVYSIAIKGWINTRLANHCTITSPKYGNIMKTDLFPNPPIFIAPFLQYIKENNIVIEPFSEEIMEKWENPIEEDATTTIREQAELTTLQTKLDMFHRYLRVHLYFITSTSRYVSLQSLSYFSQAIIPFVVLFKYCHDQEILNRALDIFGRFRFVPLSLHEDFFYDGTKKNCDGTNWDSIIDFQLIFYCCLGTVISINNDAIPTVTSIKNIIESWKISIPRKSFYKDFHMENSFIYRLRKGWKLSIASDTLLHGWISEYGVSHELPFSRAERLKVIRILSMYNSLEDF